MSNHRSALDIFNEQTAAVEAADARMCCEICGAGLTAVEAPGDKLRAWIDHAPDCPVEAGVFVIDGASVRDNPVSIAEIPAIVAEAIACVEAEGYEAADDERCVELHAKLDALTRRHWLFPGHGPAAALMDAVRTRLEYVPELDAEALPIHKLPVADVDLLIELCDRLAIVKGKRWNAQYELRAAKERK